MSDAAAIPQAVAEAPEPSAEERARRKATCEELAEIGMGLLRELRPGPPAGIDPEAEEARLHLARLNIAAFAAAGRIVCYALRESAKAENPSPARRRDPVSGTLAKNAAFDRDFRFAVAAARRDLERESALMAPDLETDEVEIDDEALIGPKLVLEARADGGGASQDLTDHSPSASMAEPAALLPGRGTARCTWNDSASAAASAAAAYAPALRPLPPATKPPPA